MDNYFNKKSIRDSICGLISLSKYELELIDLPIFQRLRKVRQNGFLSMVFPSATHTRFSHSLGVLHFASTMISHLLENTQKENVLKKEDQQIIRFAALLHDIGHSPFSHTLENVAQKLLPSTTDKITPKEKQNRIMTKHSRVLGLANTKAITKDHPSILMNQKKLYGHEIIGSMIIANHPDIRRIMTKAFGSRHAKRCIKEVRRTICGDTDNLVYKGILHGELDADKCDYLKRDSIAIGVPYGMYEFEHIFKNMKIDVESQSIVYHYKALKSLEHFLFSRYFLYNQIFYHKTNIGFNILAEKSYDALLRNGEFLDPGDLIKSMNNNDFSIFDRYDDQNFLINCDKLYAKLKRKLHPTATDKTDMFYLRSVLYRIPLKPVLICETFEDTSDTSHPSSNPDYVAVKNYFDDDIKTLSEKSKVAREWIITASIRTRITKIPNKLPSDKFRQGLDDPGNEEEIRIYQQKPESSSTIKNVNSSLIKHLSTDNLSALFVFTKDEEYRKKLCKVLKKRTIEKKYLIV